MSIPKLVDRSVLAARRRRADREFLESGSLFGLVAEELLTRAGELGFHEFQETAVISGQPEYWQQVFPDARQVPDDDELGLMPGRHDLVMHCLTLHWANDPVGQLIQCRHSLREGGLFLGVLFGGDTLAELRESMILAETMVIDRVSPRVLPMSDVRSMGDLLPRAGYFNGVADRLQVRKRYRTTLGLMHEIRAMGETNAMNDRSGQFTRKTVFDRMEACYRNDHADEDGMLLATFELIFLTGWRKSS